MEPTPYCETGSSTSSAPSPSTWFAGPEELVI